MTFDISEAIRYTLFELAVPLLFSLSFVVFAWGMFLYFIPGGHDEAAKEKGKSIMLYGILIFAFMFLLWTLLTVIMQAFTNG